jgi:hypothetical protein
MTPMAIPPVIIVITENIKTKLKHQNPHNNRTRS